jgi:hypothetical protein
LIKVAETVEYEWEDWLFSHIDFATRLNEYLSKAKLELEINVNCYLNHQREVVYLMTWESRRLLALTE